MQYCARGGKLLAERVKYNMSNISKSQKVVKSDGRSRVFATIFYPESMVENLPEALQSLHVPCFLSPLHDKDFNATGEPKKPHFHCLLVFGGKKSVEQVKALIEPLGAVGCETVSDTRAYCRYLCHLDNPEKARYDIGEVQCFCGADYGAQIMTSVDKYKAVREMMAFVDANDIMCVSDLQLYASENREDWFRALCDNSTYVMAEFIKSRYWKNHGRGSY